MGVVNLCETCQRKDVCRCNSDEQEKELDKEFKQEIFGIVAVVVITECGDYKKAREE